MLEASQRKQMFSIGTYLMRNSTLLKILFQPLPGKNYTSEELAAATKNWDESNLLSGDGIGKVYHGMIDSMDVAIKKMPGDDALGLQQYDTEIRVQRSFEN